MRRGRLVLALAAAATLTLAGCSSGDGGDDTDAGATSEATEETGGAEGTIKIGIKFDQPGLGYQDGSEYTGFDVDVAKFVAGELGYGEDQIEWVQAPSAQRETLLQNGQVDMIFATYSINEERQEVVDFAGPYFIAGQDLLIRSEDAGTITGPESLNGLDLCSVSGSTSAQRVKDEYAEDTNLVEQPGYSQCVQFLLDGSVDAVTTDDIILAGLAAAQGGGELQVVGAPFSTENYGIGLPEGSEMCADINAAVAEMIEDGSWQEAVDTNTEGTGYTPSSANPPTPMADCSGVPSS
jgi:glutamate transport system substrate-binding protein